MSRPMTSFHHQDDHQQQQNILKTSINKDQYRINGVRPTPLHVHKNSHLIHKPSYSTTTSSSSISTAFSSTTNQRNRPVIIYTHSPKVIHTEPHDFMALVQKLTGISNVKKIHESTVSDEADVDIIEKGCRVAQDLNMEEDYGLTSDDFDSNERRILSEIPLFTPTTTKLDMFRSTQMTHHQQQFRRFPGDSIFSPATLEFLKPLPEC